MSTSKPTTPPYFHIKEILSPLKTASLLCMLWRTLYHCFIVVMVCSHSLGNIDNWLQVSLGQTNDLLAADYSADSLPAGKHSTRGLGRIAPDPAQTETL